MKLKTDKCKNHSESGSAAVKLIIVLVVLLLIGHAGYNYITVAYKGEDFKQSMKASVMKGAAMPSSFGKPLNIVKKKLETSVKKHNLPPTTVVDVKLKGKAITARVYYQEDISILPFGIYTYVYKFDQTETPTEF